MTDTNVLKAWYFLESLTPGEVPKKTKLAGSLFSDNKERLNINPVELTSKPWDDIYPMNTNNRKIKFQYYMDCYPQYRLVEKLRSLFHNHDEIINKNTTPYFSFTFSVNQKGEYIQESLFIPFLHFVLSEMETEQELIHDKIYDSYKEHAGYMEEHAQSLFADGVDEKSMMELKRHINKTFTTPGGQKQHDKSYYQINIQKMNEKENDLNFNSFFVDDIGKIIGSTMNETLKEFILGKEMEHDIDENRETIEDILQPHHLPMGRWPSRVEHRLSLMQQVAVNQCVQSDGKITSVNGPPGTGKTTLLKDVFAHLVVERAAIMSDYTDPNDAFHKIGQLEIEFNQDKVYKYNIHELDEPLTQFSMVVASSNNGAVENISKELPGREEIIRRADQGDDRKEIYKEYDRQYADAAASLDYFPEMSSQVTQSEADSWGLFSAALGKSSNMKRVSMALNGKNILQSKGYAPYSFSKELYQGEKELQENAWETARKEFQQLHKSIQEKIKKLQNFINQSKQMEKIYQEKMDLENQLDQAHQQVSKINKEKESIEKQKGLIHEKMDHLPTRSFFARLFRKRDPQRDELNKQIIKVDDQLLEIEKEQLRLQKLIKDTDSKLKKLKESSADYEAKKAYYDRQNFIHSTDNFWMEENYDSRQQSVLWQTDEINFERGLLFIKALEIHKLFLMKSHNKNKFALALFSNRHALNLNENKHLQYLRSMWNVMHLIIPVVSTTFASFSSMYRGINQDFISYLFIDEAGQASPQQAAGALWRSQKAVIVGDPLQIEPVVTLDRTILQDVCHSFNVSDRYIGVGASVQNVADHANPYGTYKGKGEVGLRIGIPLWVHRRCKNPMFTISNSIAYDNKMVLAKNPKEQGKGKWYHCGGKAEDAQYVPKQGELLAQKIGDLAKQGLPDVYIITPFTKVVKNIKKELRNVLFSHKNLNNWLERSVGTVHTFQGKEAGIVFFVTGTDNSTDGAADWSCSRPNLLNVAITRSKSEFYVIGDLQRFRNKPYYEEIIRNIPNDYSSQSVPNSKTVES